MRVGVVILPEHPWPTARALWQRAEELGFDHGWTYDHIAWRSLRDAPWFGAVPTLAAAATATSRLRLGPLVATPNFRHPVPFARELLALDDISGGRLVVGLGSGGTGWDVTVLGDDVLPARVRADRFAEFVELTDALLRARTTTYRGSFYAAVDAPTAPGPVQRPRPPFVVAGSGPRGMRLAATYGATWVTTGDRRGDALLDAAAGAAVVREQVGRLEVACHEVGRDPATLGRMVLTGLRLDAGLASPAAFEDTIGRYAEAGATDLVVHWPRPAEPFAGERASFEALFGGR